MSGSESAPSPEPDEAVTLADLKRQFDRLDGNMTGAFEQISRLRDTVEDLQRENEQLRAEIRRERSSSSGTKKERAAAYSARGILTRTDGGTGGLSGVAVTVSDVRSAAELSGGESFYPQTVYDAWDALADEWPFLRVRDSTGDKDKALVADVDEITASFADAYRPEGE